MVDFRKLVRLLGWCGGVIVGCGPSEIATLGGDGSTSTGPDEVASSDAGTTVDESVFGPDEQLCVDLCLSIAGSACARADETCFGWCMRRLEHAGACAEALQAVIACEAVQSLDATCRAPAGCEAEYKTWDFCRGTCSAGSGWASGSQTTCAWSAEDCYGHELETTCYTGGENSACICFADDELLATCKMGYGIQPFSGCDALSIFTTCCRDLYEEVLFR